MTSRELETQFLAGRTMQNPIERARSKPAAAGSLKFNRYCIQSQYGMCRRRQEAKIHPRPRRGCKVCLQPGSHIGPAVAAGCGATRIRSNGAAGGCAVRGNSRSHAPVAAGGASARGNPRIHRRQCRKMRYAGNRGRIRDSEASQKRRCGATRRFINCDAEGSEIRGNSKLHRRHSGKMQDAGQLADSLGS